MVIQSRTLQKFSHSMYTHYAEINRILTYAYTNQMTSYHSYLYNFGAYIAGGHPVYHTTLRDILNDFEMNVTYNSTRNEEHKDKQIKRRRYRRIKRRRYRQIKQQRKIRFRKRIKVRYPKVRNRKQRYTQQTKSLQQMRQRKAGN